MNSNSRQPDNPIELLTPTEEFRSTADTRPRMPEPLPVKLVTVEHAHLPAAAGLEPQLDDFYIMLLGLERLEPLEALIYRAENFNLYFDVLEPPLERDTLRALGIEVASLAETEKQLIEREIEHTRQKGLLPGHDSILLQARTKARPPDLAPYQ
jgi:hypothetical protein